MFFAVSSQIFFFPTLATPKMMSVKTSRKSFQKELRFIKMCFSHASDLNSNKDALS